MQFTTCGKYLVVGIRVAESDIDETEWPGYEVHLHQYDVATMSCVRVMPQSSCPYSVSFAISPCSRVVVVTQPDGVIATRQLHHTPVSDV